MKSLNETTQLIRDEHKKLRGLFRQLEVLKSRSPEMVVPVLNELCLEIQLYLELEEKLLYPAAHQAIIAKTKEETAESEFIHDGLRDHREIVQAIRLLRGQLESGQPLPFSSDWDDQIDELVSLTDTYLNGEETKFLPFVHKNLPRIDASLSMNWFDLADQIRARIHATTPADPRHAQNPNGGEQLRKSSA